MDMSLSKLCVCELLSRVWLFANPWTVAHQAPLSMGFSKQNYWTVLPFPSPGYLPDPGIKPKSLAMKADSLPSEHEGSPNWEIVKDREAWRAADLGTLSDWTAQPQCNIALWSWVPPKEVKNSHPQGQVRVSYSLEKQWPSGSGGFFLLPVLWNGWKQ